MKGLFVYLIFMLTYIKLGKMLHCPHPLWLLVMSSRHFDVADMDSALTAPQAAGPQVYECLLLKNVYNTFLEIVWDRKLYT